MGSLDPAEGFVLYESSQLPSRRTSTNSSPQWTAADPSHTYAQGGIHSCHPEPADTVRKPVLQSTVGTAPKSVKPGGLAALATRLAGVAWSQLY
eukprot:457624-Rhodomonas_salina.2